MNESPQVYLKPDFDETYQEFGPSVFRYLRRMLNSRSGAEDVLQETFMRFHVELEKGLQINHCKAWLFRVATNIVRDRQRSDIRSQIRDERWSEGQRVVDFRHRVEHQQMVVRGLEKLTPRMQRVLLLAAEGFSYKEIAGIAGIEPAYVGVLLQRARAAFKKYCEEQGGAANGRVASK